MALRSALAVALLVVCANPSPAQAPFSSGVDFPDLVGKSLSGSDLTVRMRDGQPKVIVMTFTRAGATVAKAWLDACRSDETAQRAPAPTTADAPPVPPVVCYDVRLTQEVPRVIRGFIESRMKKGLGAEERERTILVYKDEEAWRERLLVMRDNQDEAFVVLVDGQGRVQSLLRGAFNPTALKAEQAKLLAN